MKRTYRVWPIEDPDEIGECQAENVEDAVEIFLRRYFAGVYPDDGDEIELGTSREDGITQTIKARRYIHQGWYMT